MYSKQRIFEYYNKLGKQLARILAEHTENLQAPSMIDSDGKVHSHPIEKLICFIIILVLSIDIL